MKLERGDDLSWNQEQEILRRFPVRARGEKWLKARSFWFTKDQKLVKNRKPKVAVYHKTTLEKLNKLTPNRLARAFSALLRKDIGAADMRELRRDMNPNDQSACDTHDYLDSNMTMIEAFKACEVEFIDEETDFNMGIRCHSLWNKAWTIAKKAKFMDKHIPKD